MTEWPATERRGSSTDFMLVTKRVPWVPKVMQSFALVRSPSSSPQTSVSESELELELASVLVTIICLRLHSSLELLLIICKDSTSRSRCVLCFRAHCAPPLSALPPTKLRQFRVYSAFLPPPVQVSNRSHP